MDTKPAEAMTEAHTPTPWAQSHRKGLDGMHSTEIYDGSGETIATVAWYPVPQKDGSVSTAREANAAYIVLAVNSHARLVAALEDCPLPSQSAPAGEFYGRFYAWYNGQREAALKSKD